MVTVSFRKKKKKKGLPYLALSSSICQDGKLSKEEILEKYDVFVGSQATDFGEALIRHDEF